MKRNRHNSMVAFNSFVFARKQCNFIYLITIYTRTPIKKRNFASLPPTRRVVLSGEHCSFIWIFIIYYIGILVAYITIEHVLKVAVFFYWRRRISKELTISSNMPCNNRLQCSLFVRVLYAYSAYIHLWFNVLMLFG